MNHEKSKQRVNDSARLVDNNILGLNALYGILCLIKQPTACLQRIQAVTGKTLSNNSKTTGHVVFDEHHT